MSHKLSSCELNSSGICIFCGRKQDKKQWIARIKKDRVYDPIYNPKPTQFKEPA